MRQLREYEALLDQSVWQAVEDAESLPIEFSRNHLPVLRINEVQLHSLFSPVRDAERFISRWVEAKGIRDGDGVIMHGMGLGYYLEELAKQLPNSRLQVLLADPALLRTALEQRDLLSLLQDERITLHLDTTTIQRDRALAHLRLPAWRQVYPDQCRQWDQELAGQPGRGGTALRIQVVSPIHGGSLPIATSVAEAFQELGHTVNLVDCSHFAAAREQLEASVRNTAHESYLLGRLVELLSDHVLVEAERFQPQLVVVMAQAPVTTAALREFRRNGILTVYWFVEDYQRITYWQAIAPHYDLFCTIQTGEFHRQLRELGVQDPLYLPLAADTRHYHPLPPDKIADNFRSELAFVGAGYHNREIFFLGLYGEDFKIWGAEWNPRHPLWRCVQNEAARTDTSQNLQIFNGCDFNLNLHSSSHLPGVDPEGDFVNPRVFDIAAAGGFQLVDRRSLLGDLFVEGVELVIFNDIDQMREQLEYYRHHPEERREIAAAGYRRVQADHTYARRMEQLLEAAAERFPQLYRQGESRNSAGALRRELPEDGEWQGLLAGYPDDQELTLSQLEEDLELKGELNTAGMVVLFAAELERWARAKQLLAPAALKPPPQRVESVTAEPEHT